MTEDFARLIGPIVQHLIDFQQRLASGTHPGLREERDELLALFDEAQHRAEHDRDLTERFDLARHALVYWIDEVLINSSWVHAEEWKNYILEWVFYQDRRGAYQFYRVAPLAQRRNDTDAIETFYLCVTLGFRGQFREDPQGLVRWTEEIYGWIENRNQHPDVFLPEDDHRGSKQQSLQPLDGPSMLMIVSILVSVSLVISVLTFMIVAQWSG